VSGAKSGVAWVVPLVAVLALAALDSLGKTYDPDVYWHLLTAKTALAAGSSLPRDMFSYSFDGGEWAYKDLVADVVLYAGFARFGYAWFAALKAGVVLAVAGATYVALPPRVRGGSALAWLLSVGLVVDAFWLTPRPHLFSFAIFVWVLALLDRARRVVGEAGKGSARAITSAFAPIVALDVAWTCLHRFAILGYLALFAFAAFLGCARVAQRWPVGRALFGPAPSRRFAWAAFGVAVVTPVVAVLNPAGLASFTTSIKWAAHPEVHAVITEWTRVRPLDLARAFPAGAALVMMTQGAVAWRIARAVRAREEDPPVTLWHAAIVFTLFAMTLASVRWVPYVALASGLVLACVVADVIAGASRPVPRGASVLVALVVLVLLRVRQEDAPLALGEDPAWTPRGAVEYAQSHGLRGRVANCLELGGYLLWRSWPDVSVLVDGRNDQVYPPQFVVRTILSEHDAPTFAAMRTDDGATWALGANTPEQVVFGFLARDPAWALAYWSDTAAVYVRRDAHPTLTGELYRFVDPFDVPASIGAAVARSHGDRATLDAILGDVRRMLDASPESVRANLALATFFDGLGPAGVADRDAVLAHLLDLTHDAPAIVAIVGALQSHRFP
jgi:hypothetical protein